MDFKDYYNRKTLLYRTNSARERRIIQLIPKNVKMVLDIGCGRANLAVALKGRGYIVSGVDISDKALKETSEFLKDAFCFNVEDDIWPKELLDKKYDMIVASEIIEHLFLPNEFMKKVTGLLEENGKIVVTIPNFLFWKNRLKMSFGKFKYEEKGLLDFGHIRFFTYETAKELFEYCDLKVEKENHFYPNLYKRKLNFLGNFFPGFFAYQLTFLLSPKKS